MSSGYNNKGLYNKYDKNHSEREKLDYYATPTKEVLNILDTLQIDFSNSTILEPCIGGGHMALGIEEYINKNHQTNIELIGTDIMDRGFKSDTWKLSYGKEQDFFLDTYQPSKVDYIICNPPYSVIEPFVIRALEIAKEKVIMLARWQFFEGAGRYENILRDNPPSEAWVYVDRIQCWKDGVKPSGSGAQAFCWIVWNKSDFSGETKIKYIRRTDKIN